MKTNTAIALYVCLAAAPFALAQDPTGAIEGLITDASASALTGAKVTAENLDTGFTKETITVANGLFRIPLLPVGRYSITSSAPAFKPTPSRVRGARRSKGAPTPSSSPERRILRIDLSRSPNASDWSR